MMIEFLIFFIATMISVSFAALAKGIQHVGYYLLYLMISHAFVGVFVDRKYGLVYIAINIILLIIFRKNLPVFQFFEQKK